MAGLALWELPGCITNSGQVEVHERRDLHLPRTGRAAQLVRFTGWRQSQDGPKRVDPITAVQTALPELLGRLGPWSSYLTEEDGKTFLQTGALTDRDQELMPELRDRAFAEAMWREPLGDRFWREPTRLRDVVQDSSLRVVYEAGSLVARVRDADVGTAEVDQLVEIADRAVERSLAVAPAPVAVDAHFGPDREHDVPDGLETLDQVRDALAPRRRLRRRPDVTDDAVRAAFAQSYARARGLRNEHVPHAAVVLRLFGVPGRPVLSLVGRSPEGRPMRQARVRDVRSLPPGRGRVDVVSTELDVLVDADLRVSWTEALNELSAGALDRALDRLRNRDTP